MLTDDQKAEREQALGSSDAPVVCGISPYSSPTELYYKLTGALPRYDEQETDAQKIGSRLEPVIAELAAEKLGLNIRRMPVRKHKAYPFLIAHNDFEIVNNPKGPGVLEIKNRSGQHPWDELPDDIATQVAHQLAVSNREWGVVAVLFQFGQIKPYEVHRDKELEDYLLEIEIRFMERVRKQEPPDTQWNSQTIGILKRLYPTDSGNVLTLPDQHAMNCQGFLAAKKDMEAAKERKALYEGLLKDAMRDASKATLPGYKISWKTTKASQEFDKDQFEQDYPDLYRQYLKTVPGYRKFLLTPSKELAK